MSILHIFFASLLVSGVTSHIDEPISLMLRRCCLTVLHDLGTELTKNIMLNLDVMDDETDKRSSCASLITSTQKISDIEGLRRENACVTGISEIEKASDLESNLPTDLTGELILISANNSEMTPPSTVSPLHEIIIIDQNEKHFTSKLICKEGTGRLQTLNIFNQKRTNWELEVVLDNLDLKRKCNGGYHPLYGKSVRASNYGIPPFLVADDSWTKIKGGVSTELFKAIADHYEFTPETKLSKSAFKFNPDGSIGGSFGEVLYGMADVSLEQSIELGFFFGTMSRYTYYHTYGYMEQKPKQKPRYTNIVNPFDSLTWYAILASFLAVSLALWLITKEKDSLFISLMYNLQMTFGIMFQEFHLTRKKKHSFNFMVMRLIWTVGSLFISMAFLANLKSSLMKKHFEKRTMTLEEMVDKDMMIHSSDIFTSYLESPNGQSPLNKRLLCQIKEKDTVFSLEQDEVAQAVNIVDTQGGSLLLSKSVVQVIKSNYMLKGKDFPFLHIPQWYSTTSIGMLFRKFDRRADYFNPVISTLNEAGVVDYFFKREMPYADIKEQVKASEENLRLEHYVIPFIFLGGGLTTGLVAMFGEKGLFSKKGKSVLVLA